MPAAKKHIKIVKKRTLNATTGSMRTISTHIIICALYIVVMGTFVEIDADGLWKYRHEAVSPTPKRHLHVRRSSVEKAKGYRQSSATTFQGSNGYAVGMLDYLILLFEKERNLQEPMSRNTEGACLWKRDH